MYSDGVILSDSLLVLWKTRKPS